MGRCVEEYVSPSYSGQGVQADVVFGSWPVGTIDMKAETCLGGEMLPAYTVASIGWVGRVWDGHGRLSPGGGGRRVGGVLRPRVG